ncbi:MAG: hypothetical protein LW817_09040 [Candidatus Caenarcaniphilales bacterium]|nr:hypothetical protein [Candidatus Caenarcaniphilales bacterium]
MANFNLSTFDLIFLVSFTIYAVCLVIFLVYFIPVLIQLSKTLEAAQILLNTVKNYELSAKNKVLSMVSSIGSLGSILSNKFKDLTDLISSKLKK